MKRFSILSTLALLCAIQVFACGPWARPMYYVFSAYNRQQLGETFTPQLEKFWANYTGQDGARYDMQGLNWVNPEEFDKSQNAIIRTAIDRGDREMEQYLRSLVAYLKASEGLDDENWQYPTKSQLKKQNQRMQYLNNVARAYNGTRLRPQYCLLAMRTLMGQGDTQGIINYWTKAESTLQPSVYKEMMRNIYAGALLRTGKRKEACDIYAEQGDMLSLKWIMRDGRNLDGIKGEYNRDPNAPTLIYLVQDFVNIGSQTLRAQYEYDWDNPAYISASQNEMRQFIAFAQKVVKDGKTKVPALWQSAAGYLTCELGDTPAGLSMLDKAIKMKGTERMLDNARVCRWVASMATADASTKYQDYFLNELKWMQTVEKKEIEEYHHQYNSYGFVSNHYTEVLQNIMYDIMPPKAQKWGNSNLATAMMGWMNNHERQLDSTTDDPEGYYICSDYKYALDHLTAQEMIQYRDYLNGKGANTALERYLNAGKAPYMTAEYFNDRIGTKYIREGNFEAAIPFLEEVSLDYYGKQAISYYMARRDYNVDRWFRRQVVCHGEYWGECEETPTPVKYHQKLNFCRDMVMLKNTIANPVPEDDNDIIYVPQLKYKMASLYYQASYKGDCWYISRYGQSAYDSVCYRNEKDFVAEAAHLLDEALEEMGPNGDFTLRQNVLYARAYVPFGDRYHTQTWDADYNVINHYNKQSREYQTMAELASFVKGNQGRVNNKISRCDVLKQFLNGKYTGFWPE